MKVFFKKKAAIKVHGFKAQITLQNQNKLNKVHTDRMNERNSNEDRYLEV